MAEVTGTPVYVYDADAVRAQWRRLEAAFASVPHRVHYSVKANSNLAVLALLEGLGAGADIVSGGELARVLRAGFAPGDVVYSGVGKSRAELEAAVSAGVGLINLESPAEFDVLRAVAGALNRPVSVGIRVNPDVTTETHPYTQTGARGMKFGVPLDGVLPLATAIAAADGIELASVGMHIGSQIADPASYAEGAAKLEALVGAIRGAGIDSLTSVDVGGGLAVRYTDERMLDPQAFADAVRPLHEATGLTLLMEPGRYLVGNGGVLLTSVLYRKHSGGRDFVIVDAGMNDFVRPSLYGARHGVRVIDPGDVSGAPAAAAADVVGPICETGDFLGLGVELAPLGPGGVLAVGGAGAYGFSMSSTYNSRPRAAEVLVDGNRFGVVRARESVEDLWRGETREPAWQAETGADG